VSAEKFPEGATEKKRKVALLSLFQGGNGKRPKNSKKKNRKIALLSLIYYICIMYENSGGSRPLPPLPTLMPHSRKTWVQPSASPTKRLKKLVFTVSLLD